MAPSFIVWSFQKQRALNLDPNARIRDRRNPKREPPPNLQKLHIPCYIFYHVIFHHLTLYPTMIYHSIYLLGVGALRLKVPVGFGQGSVYLATAILEGPSKAPQPRAPRRLRTFKGYSELLGAIRDF